MKGRYRVQVNNNRSSYKFELKRNITILCGDSATGKTGLFEMIAEYNNLGRASGVHLSCDVPVISLVDSDWQDAIRNIRKSIIVLDESNNRFIRSKEFAELIKESDCYFLIISRFYLSQLPYSVEEIYELKGAKNKEFKRVYENIDLMYEKRKMPRLPFVPEVIITEDSGAGFQFFCNWGKKNGIKCVSAEGKSNIFKLVDKYGDMNTLIIADGADIGSEILDIVHKQEFRPNKLAIFLPESFEWLILKAGIVDPSFENILDKPEEYIESGEFFSWERYFTKLLEDATQGSNYNKYDKNRLPDYYLQSKVEDAVKRQMPGVIM